MTLNWTWSGLDCDGLSEVLRAFVILVGITDGTGVEPMMTPVAETTETAWIDTVPDPPPGFVAWYRVEAEDSTGNSSQSCEP